jgi:tRNA G10  N-methylase Trm11
MNNKVALFLKNNDISIVSQEGVKYALLDLKNNSASCIILPNEKYEMSIDRIVHSLYGITFEELIDESFKSLGDFPYYEFNEKVLKKDYKNLINAVPEYNIYKRFGMKIVNYYHKSIFDAHKNGNLSYTEAWKNEKIMKFGIKNCFIYFHRFSNRTLLEALNNSKKLPKVSVFSPLTAKYLINKYYHDEKVVFDPFSGFSGRMLGTCSLGKTYIGSDISSIAVEESNKIATLLSLDAFVTKKNVKDYKRTERLPVLFTCSPYGLKETWNNKEQDDYSCDEWISQCLIHCNCPSYLFVVDKTEKYKGNIVEELHHKYQYGDFCEYVVKI